MADLSHREYRFMLCSLSWSMFVLEQTDEQASRKRKG